MFGTSSRVSIESNAEKIAQSVALLIDHCATENGDACSRPRSIDAELPWPPRKAEDQTGHQAESGSGVCLLEIKRDMAQLLSRLIVPCEGTRSQLMSMPLTHP